MTLAELQQRCWDDLPMRKWLAGRARVDTLVEDAIRSWSPAAIAACATKRQRDAYAEGVLLRVQARYGEGFVWVFLLMAVASAVIQWLVTRWLNNHFDRQAIAALHDEMTR